MINAKRRTSVQEKLQVSGVSSSEILDERAVSSHMNSNNRFIQGSKGIFKGASNRLSSEVGTLAKVI